MNEEEIYSVVVDEEGKLRTDASRLWRYISVDPALWSITNSNKKTKEFWVVAIVGKMAIWYNHLEEGFVRTTYISWGSLSHYEDAAMSLEYILEQTLREIEGETKYSS